MCCRRRNLQIHDCTLNVRRTLIHLLVAASGKMSEAHDVRHCPVKMTALASVGEEKHRLSIHIVARRKLFWEPLLRVIQEAVGEAFIRERLLSGTEWTSGAVASVVFFLHFSQLPIKDFLCNWTQFGFSKKHRNFESNAGLTNYFFLRLRFRSWFYKVFIYVPMHPILSLEVLSSITYH